MAYRITIKNLQALAATLNGVMGTPTAAYRREPSTQAQNDVLRANIGNYHISQAYGGYCLHCMVNESGGVSDVFSCGHIPARDLFERMHAFMRGIEAGQFLAAKKGD